MSLDDQLQQLKQLADEWKSLPAEELLASAIAIYRDRFAIMTSMQNAGIVMMHMAHEIDPSVRVFTIDTLRLFPETYELMDKLNDRFSTSIEVYAPDPSRIISMLENRTEYLFFDSKENQELCCAVRKKEPKERALITLDAYATGLRFADSEYRGKNGKKALVHMSSGVPKLQIAPVMDWSDDRINEYIRVKDLPYNALLDQGYATIGCIICTTPVHPSEDKRAGRWRWQKETSKECNINEFGGGAGI